MKNLLQIITTILVIFLIANMPGAAAAENPGNSGPPLKIICSPDLYNLALEWAADYQKMNKGAVIETAIIEPSEIETTEIGDNEIALFSERYLGALPDAGYWKAAVGRDVVVPVMNPNNPLHALIRHAGLSPGQLASIFSVKDAQNWGALDETGKNEPVHVMLPDDENVRQTVADFLSVPPDKLSAENIATTAQLVEKITSDKYGLAWCKLTDVTDPDTGGLLEGIALLPIDRNGNGKIDHFENIYSEINDFNRGVWIGKYPRILVTDIYSVVPYAGLQQTGSTFMKWAITDGQKSMEATGHNPMLSIEKTSVLDDLTGTELYGEASANGLSALSLVFLILGGLVVLILIFTFVSGKFGKKTESPHAGGDSGEFISGESLLLPAGLYFDKTHTWTFMEKDGQARVGIDDFLQHVVGNFTGVVMKDTGDKVKKSEHLVTLIHDGKQINLYSPVSGTIRAINTSLEKTPNMINSSPYEDGWLYMIEPTNWIRETGFMQMAAKHEAWLRTEFTRLKDFLAARLHPGNTPGFALQDGGMLRDHVLEDLDPEIWEDFQKCFIDTPL